MSANGYIRQSAADIQAGLAINASDLNNEFNQLQSAFDNSTGHDHTGSVTGDGQPINLTTAVTGILPAANGGTGTSTSPLPVANGGSGRTDGQNLLPSGMIAPFAAVTPPSGWLYCDGSAVSRTTYAALFAVVSTIWGTGDGSTTFNIPDFRGRTLAGYDSGNSTGRMTSAVNASAIANTGGEQSHTLITGELAAHSHTVTDPGHTHTVTDGGHTHGVTDSGHTHTITDPKHTHGVTDSGHIHGVSDGGHSHSAIGGAGFYLTGTGSQPAPATTANIGVENTNTTVDTTGIGINNATTGITNVSAATGITGANSATSGITNNSATSGITNNTNTTGLTTNNAGSGSAHNNVQPTAIVGWIIKT